MGADKNNIDSLDDGVWGTTTNQSPRRHSGFPLMVPNDQKVFNNLNNTNGTYKEDFSSQGILGDIECIAVYDKESPNDGKYCKPSPTKKKQFTMASPSKYTGYYMADLNQKAIMDRKGDFSHILSQADENHMYHILQKMLNGSLQKGGQSFLIMGVENKLTIFRLMAKLSIIMFSANGIQDFVIRCSPAFAHSFEEHF